MDAYRGAPQRFRGETGAQSAIVPALDAALGIHHPESALRVYLEEMLEYMPSDHRAFIAHLTQQAAIRRRVQESRAASLARAYNRCLRVLASFRSHHLDYAPLHLRAERR